MATPAQIIANRENAKKSTGPRTPEGKFASSRNRLTHGLCAELHFFNDEDPGDFQALHDDLCDRFRPVGAGEERLVLRIAYAQWRLDRAMTLEVQINRRHFPRLAGPQDPKETFRLGQAFILDSRDGGSLQKASRYEAALERSISSCLRQLKIFQQARAEAAAARPPAPPEITEGTQSDAQPGAPSAPSSSPDRRPSGAGPWPAEASQADPSGEPQAVAWLSNLPAKKAL